MPEKTERSRARWASRATSRWAVVFGLLVIALALPTAGLSGEGAVR